MNTPDWKDIRHEWETKDVTFKELGIKHGVNERTVSKRKNREGWERKISLSRTETVKTKRTTESKRKKAQKDIPIVNEDGFEITLAENLNLNDKQQMFCYYYLKNLNPKMAAIQAGYSANSAHVTGYKLLAHPIIAEEVRRLKKEMRQGIFIDAMDVLHKYIQIAFADITDFAWFGKKEVPIMGEMGPLEDEDGNPLTTEINFVDFKDSEFVDGSLITEVKQGKEGIVVKLADKMEALRFLSKHFDMVPDHFKRKLEEEKLKLQYKKVTDDEGIEEYEDDGFKEALQGSAKEVWTDAATSEARDTDTD